MKTDFVKQMELINTVGKLSMAVEKKIEEMKVIHAELLVLYNDLQEHFYGNMPKEEEK